MTAHGSGELGCFTHVDSPTSLALPTEGTIVQDVVLGVHGVFVAWASSDALQSRPTLTAATPTPTSASLTRTTSPSTSSTLAITSPSPSRTTPETPHASSSNPSQPTNAAEANSTPSLTTTPSPKLAPSIIIGISAGAVAGALALVGLSVLAILCRRRRCRRLSNESVEVRVFDSATEFYDDKRMWSVGSSADAVGAGIMVAEADSRAVVGGRAELEGD